MNATANNPPDRAQFLQIALTALLALLTVTT
jgi:hypothetical protein